MKIVKDIVHKPNLTKECVRKFESFFKSCHQRCTHFMPLVSFYIPQKTGNL